MSKEKTIDIKPSVSLLSLLQHVNYKHWHAFAEYVDNSIQSSLEHKEELDKIHGGCHSLQIDISLDREKEEIQILDNSTGISAGDFERALRPGEFPPNRSGLSEFGIGMKAASCWFSRKWSVETKHFESDLVRVVHFDVDDIVKNNKNKLQYTEKSGADVAPYTRITLKETSKIPQTKSLGKVKDYLADIYRVFIREGTITLRIDGKAVEHKGPKILVAPYYKDPNGEKKEWKVELDIPLEEGRHVRGFAALQKKGNRSKSGFSLFRRNRVIEGSGDAGYRPKEIFGNVSSFEYLRIFGELHLSGFDVSYTKDGFRWDDSEEDFIYALKRELKKDGEFLNQAHNYRASSLAKEDPTFDKKTLDRAAGTLSAPGLEESLISIINEHTHIAPSPSLDNTIEAWRSMDRHFSSLGWKVNIRFHDTPDPAEWFTVNELETTDRLKKNLQVDIFISHRIMLEFAYADKNQLEIFVKFAIAVALASCAGIPLGSRRAEFIRSFNKVLPAVLGKK